tara:strand:+ start:2509 stop:2646 length:138 start_codon:yes stop_codon:yes gene_type:complete
MKIRPFAIKKKCKNYVLAQKLLGGETKETFFGYNVSDKRFIPYGY